MDFLLKDGLKIGQLIQVCYSVDNIETKEGEIKSLVKASKKLGCENAIIITWDTEDEEIVKNTRLKLIPLWKWLLSGLFENPDF